MIKLTHLLKINEAGDVPTSKINTALKQGGFEIEPNAEGEFSTVRYLPNFKLYQKELQVMLDEVKKFQKYKSNRQIMGKSEEIYYQLLYLKKNIKELDGLLDIKSRKLKGDL